MNLVDSLLALEPVERLRVLERLSDPQFSLPEYGVVKSPKNELALLPYDPAAITTRMQSTILSYIGNPPRTVDGYTNWLVVLGARQSGKSFAAAAGLYCKAAYTTAYDALTIADKEDRANYLHSRVHLVHENWPEETRSPKVGSKERRQLTFDPTLGIGGKIRIMSSHEAAAGIGQSPSAVHASELPFWDDARGFFTLMFPAVQNRFDSLVILESTPAAEDAPSTPWWKETCHDASLGRARWIYAFFPFWDNLTCRRPWPKGSALDSEEEGYLKKYGPQGLTRENLAFRRYVLEQDPEIRRNPVLFEVYFPFNDITCWMARGAGVVPASALVRVNEQPVIEWVGPYMEYEEPEQGVRYVIGADGAGWGVRDHASFQVLRVYAGEWTQVACFSSNEVEPQTFGKVLFDAGMRYGGAEIVAERNGVGAAVLAYLLDHEYPEVYYSEDQKPGKNASARSNDEMLGWLIDAMQECLVLNDKDTLLQLGSYRNDKRIETSAQSELVTGRIGKGRRARHHWDKVSALQMAVVGAREGSQPSRPRQKVDSGNVRLFSQLTYNEIEAYRRAEAVRTAVGAKGGMRYTRMRYRRH